MVRLEDTERLIQLYKDKQHDLRIFMDGVVSFIADHPDLRQDSHRVVHSYKSRLKDIEHVREKISRKSDPSNPITAENFFDRVTDLAGVRILHLFQGEFASIDGVVRKRVGTGDWVLGEKPKAYTWDPDSAVFFQGFDLNVTQKATSYTSVHYLLKPRADSPICCELQVRTLFEEIWGEIDHRINYPKPSKSIACREQIAVLSKLIGAGSRLLDALERVNGNDGNIHMPSDSKSKSTPMTRDQAAELLSKVDSKSARFLRRIAANKGKITWDEMRAIFGIEERDNWNAYSRSYGRGITRAYRHLLQDKSARLVWWIDSDWENEQWGSELVAVYIDGDALLALREASGF